MKLQFKAILLGLIFVSLAPNSRAAQTSQASEPSLGDVARKLKAEKSKEPKPVRVITNDTIEAGSEPSLPEAKEAKPSPTSSEAPEAKSTKHNAEYYRAQMSTLKSKLADHERELNVLQQKLGQNQMQYYTDPNKSLMQQYSRDDVNKLTDDIDAKKKQIDGDNQAIDDLHDQLRHEGGDPAWLR